MEKFALLCRIYACNSPNQPLCGVNFASFSSAQEVQSFCIVDSTSLPVNGYNRRAIKWGLNQVGTAKNMHGWYQGFKLYLIINQNHQIISLKITQANVHDVQLLK